MVLLPPSSQEIRNMIIAETRKLLEVLENNVDAEKLVSKKNTLNVLIDALRYKEKEDKSLQRASA